MRRIIPLLVLSVVLINGCVAVQDGDRTHKVVSVQEAHEMIERDSSVLLLDVRTPAEFRSETGRLAGAILIPIQELEERIEELEPYNHKTILVYCRTGNRSGRAAELLTKKGFRAFNVVGGIVKWNELKLPVLREDQE